MKAMVFHKYGSPDVLQLEEIPKPTPKDDEVLVKVHAASINDWDWAILRGKPFTNRMIYGLLKPNKVKILGLDIAGRVEAVGSDVNGFQAGDEVFGDISGSGFGGLAEYVRVRENAVALKPHSLTFEQASAVPHAAVLALQGLNYKRRIQPGEKLLINGAGGGMGTLAIQIAKHFGAEVTAVDNGNKLDMLTSLGADHVIDYTREDFTRNGLRYDRIIDVAAFRSTFDFKRALAPGGIYGVIGGGSIRIMQTMFVGPFIAISGSKKMGLVLLKQNKDLETIVELIEAGKLAPIIDRTFSFDEVPEAFRYFGKSLQKGKIVITVNDAND